MTRRSKISAGSSVTEARKAYHQLLARQGLVDFSPEELHCALAKLESEDGSHIATADVRFQAAVNRLKAQAGLSNDTVRDVIRQLLAAEYECDQAQWEHYCQRMAYISHTYPVSSIKARPA